MAISLTRIYHYHYCHGPKPMIPSLPSATEARYPPHTTTRCPRPPSASSSGPLHGRHRRSADAAPSCHEPWGLGSPNATSSVNSVADPISKTVVRVLVVGTHRCSLPTADRRHLRDAKPSTPHRLVCLSTHHQSRLTPRYLPLVEKKSRFNLCVFPAWPHTPCWIHL